MNKKQWKTTLKKKMTEAGTYAKTFEPVMDKLAAILEQCDRAFDEFLDNGGEMVVETVSDRGAVNFRKNPRLQVWMDLNAQALAYWRDLGLTPAGLKKLNDLALKEKRGSALDEALQKLTSS